MRDYAVPAVFAALFAFAGCGGKTAVTTPPAVDAVPQLEQLWVDPGNVPRDLFWGSGGRQYAPPPAVSYTIVDRDDTGFSVSYDVTSPDGTEWSAKVGPEAQTEVVVSRILWGLGYHQPPVYYLPSWTAAGSGGQRMSEARFRPKLAALDRTGPWEWADNPFVGARPFRGLLVVLLMLNGTDLKDDNNSVYDVKDGWGAAQGGAPRWFVVRDLGAALGETGKLYPRRNWLEGFERSGFITAVHGERVEFDYRGRHQALLEMLRPADVRWAAERLARLTPEQWQDAFRAGNYAEPIAGRFIRKIQSRIAEGLALPAPPAE